MATIGNAIGSLCSAIYGQISGFITILAIVCFSICLVGMMVSNNQKTVETFRAWRNRILISWLIFSCLGTLSNGLLEWLGESGLNKFSAQTTGGA
ncbi:MAG: hypothetical protein UH542_08810 [Bacteroidales bacterium]|nr:hypothetical protein [Bacteroidales bacterium]